MLLDTVIEAVGAAASLAAVVYARKTVGESIKARKDGETAHREQMAELARAGEAAFQQSSAQLLQMTGAQSLEAARHEAQMADRRRLAETEAESRRIVQLERISKLLLEIVDTARDEYRVPPPPLSAGVTGSRLFAMLRRLDNALAAFAALGGDVPDRLMDFAHDAPMRARTRESVISVVGDGIAALDAIQTAITRIRLVED